ncbi:MAG: LamG domain-containing protein [Sedimentisphaerales bacterium]|nr:LamG domain-containing protein [Sedimentisphaerales bacterium]
MKKLVLTLVVLLTASTAMGDLAGYWTFDEGNGTTAADSSGQNKTGVLQAADSVNYPQWVAGYSGSALQFNAATTGAGNANRVYVDITGTDLLADLGEAFTISMWVKRSAENAYRPRLVSNDAYEVQLAADPNGTAVTLNHDWFWSTLGGASWQIDMDYSAAAQQAPSDWYHIAITYDGNYFRKYINGLVVFHDLGAATFSQTATTDLFLAAVSDYSNYYVGALDDVAIWSGGYLPSKEVWNLYKGAATPLTAQERGPEATIPALVKELKDGYAWQGGYGWKTLWDQSFNWDLSVAPGYIDSNWWLSNPIKAPAGRQSTWYNKWYVRTEDTYSTVPLDVDTHGVIWADPLWEGEDPNLALVRVVAYITPGLVLGQQSWGFQLYRPELYSWENKDYFKTYAHITSINGEGAEFRLRTFSYPEPGGPNTETPWSNPEILTYLGEVIVPLSGNDWEWQDFKWAVPKPTDGLSSTRVWFEAGIENGNPDTVLFIDELNPISDQTVTYGQADYNHDSIVYRQDLSTLAGYWLDSAITDEPRTSGMLVNGDFYEDKYLVSGGDSLHPGLTPLGWSLTGVGGEYGLARVGDQGWMNFTDYILTPLGGSVAFYSDDPNYILEQTTTENAVEGHTYYAMAYVMAADWNSWKDFLIITLEINGVDVETFVRPMSRNRWRPVYGEYVATAADAGHAIKLKLSYANEPIYTPTSGRYYIGYVYLDDAMPAEWPEERDNILVNGGFEDLDYLENSPIQELQDLYETLSKSDNFGAWFKDDFPAPTNWVFEVDSSFNEQDEGGIISSGYHGSPLPTSGMNDISIYATEDLKLGQVIDSLTPSTTYYLDMACAVNSGSIEPGAYPVVGGVPQLWSGVNRVGYGEGTVAWPNPAPTFHLELWRIPTGVTDGSVIYNAINSSNPDYVKIAEATASATGNLWVDYGVTTAPKSKWQLVGTTYTAVAADADPSKNLYVRVYGVHESGTMPAGFTPEFAFSDVYLSTQPRLVPGGSATYNIAAGMTYDVGGPYTCPHRVTMGLDPVEGDINGDCIVSLEDYSIIAAEWLDYAFEYINQP